MSSCSVVAGKNEPVQCCTGKCKFKHCINSPSTYIGAILILAAFLATRFMQKDWTKSFKEATRHLTCWNVLLASIFLLVLCAIPTKAAAVIGIGLVSLSFFVLFGRMSAIPHLDPKDKFAVADIITHYIIPLTMVGFMLAGTMGVQYTDSSVLWQGLLVYIGIFVLWLLVNFICVKCGLEWAYKHEMTNPFHKDRKQPVRILLLIWIVVFSFILTAFVATMLQQKSI